MIAIDSNIVLRYLLADDSRQGARTARLIDDECSDAGRALVTNVVLAEVVWYIDRVLRRPKPEILEVLWALMDNRHVTFEDRDVIERSVQEYEAGKAGFADYLIAFSALACGALRTYTFDEDAAKHAPFALLKP